MNDTILSLPQDLPVRLIGEPRSDLQPAVIEYGRVRMWFGDCLVGFSDVGLVWLEPAHGELLPDRLKSHWHNARSLRNEIGVRRRLQRLCAGDGPVVVHMTGTDFQLQVWNLLSAIPSGARVSYGQLAEQLGNAGYARAVGGAVGKNHVACFVPCHRVVPAGGGAGGYRWGSELKQRLLAAESPAFRRVMPGS